MKAKKEPIRHLGLRIPASLHERLVSAAVADRRSLTQQVLILLAEALDARKARG